MKLEHRKLSPGQAGVCVERGCKKPRIRGYGAVFFDGSPDTEYRYGSFVERISPQAFDRALKERQAVVALFNHDPDHVLGKTTSGTLRLETDKRGLKYEIELPDTRLGLDLAEMISRGDLDGSSFSFYTKRQTWEEPEEGDDIRTIEDLDLVDVGPVTFPAYGATSVEAASRDRADWKRRRQLDLAKERLTRIQKLVDSV